MNWDADFAGLPPIELADGSKLRTLSECRAYMLKLADREQRRIEWRGAAAALRQAAKHGGPFLALARAAFSKALQRPPAVRPAPTQREKFAAKRAKWKARKENRRDKKPTI